MKIAVNTRLLIHNNMSGMGVFTSETFRRIVASHPEHTFYFLFDRHQYEPFITSSNIIPRVVSPKVRHHPVFLHYWYEYALPKVLNQIKPDIFISPDGFMSLKTKIPTLTVIHDINFEHSNIYLNPVLSWFYRKYTPQYAKKSIRLATVSEFSKQDIVRQYGIAPDKIDVVYNGAGSGFFPTKPEQQKTFRQKVTEGNPYFIFVGVLHARKNIINQLKAFDIFKKNSGHNYKFIIVGHKWKWTKEMEDVIKNMTFRDDIVFTGHLPEDELKLAVGSATALMYVSNFEGFGIPILEAFQCGIPVITSKTSSMPEVAGNAALYADPENSEEIASLMQQICETPTLRNSCIEKGFERCKFFSWEKTASLLWDSIVNTGKI